MAVEGTIARFRSDAVLRQPAAAWSDCETIYSTNISVHRVESRSIEPVSSNQCSACSDWGTQGIWSVGRKRAGRLLQVPGSKWARLLYGSAASRSAA